MKKFLIGIDIGGTSIKLGALDPSRKIKYQYLFKTHYEANDSEFIVSLVEAIGGITSQFKGDEVLGGIGIGSPGPIDAHRGVIYQTANLKNLRNCKVKLNLEKKFGVNVYLQNDANCAAIGHNLFGFGKNESDFAVITLGTGVGGGLILNNQLFTGYKGNSFEIGHTTFADKDFLDTKYYVQCGCGRMGCLESFASASAVVNMYNFFQKHRKKEKRVQFPKEVSDLIEKNDPIAKKVFKVVGRSLGLSVANVIQNLNLSLVIFTGGLSGSSKYFAEELESTVKEKVFSMFYSRLKIKYTIGNENFSILGAASLCFDSNFSNNFSFRSVIS